MTGRGKAAILTYHSVSNGPAPLCMPPETFAKQMEWLRENANMVSLADLIELLTQGGVFPERTVALTFDDAFGDFAYAAAPVLSRLNLPAIVFLPTAYCGSAASWDPRTGNRMLMTWDQIKHLSRQGFEFGSHSVTHPDLVRIPEAELKKEIVGSRHQIEEELRQDIRFFCYPYGCFNSHVRRIVSSCYAGGACTTELRPVMHGDDLYALPRVDAHYLRNFCIFRFFLKGHLGLYLNARRIVRALFRPGFRQAAFIESAARSKRLQGRASADDASPAWANWFPPGSTCHRSRE